MQRLFFLFSITFLSVLTSGLFADESSLPIWQRSDYLLETPDIIALNVESKEIPADELKMINGTHLIAPDGNIILGQNLKAHIQDMTLANCKKAIHNDLAKKFRIDPASIDVHVEVFSCNSKEYYVIFQYAAGGEQVMAFPYTGKESVWKAISNAHGLPPNSSKRIWVARTAGKTKPVILPVDWVAITTYGMPDTNYQLLPGDRVFVQEEMKDKQHQTEKKVWDRETWSKKPEPVNEVKEVKREEINKVESTKKRIARSVFFKSDQFAVENLELLAPFQTHLKSTVTMSFIVQKNPEGIWLILFGDEETVTELHTVFSEIAEGAKN